MSRTSMPCLGHIQLPNLLGRQHAANNCMKSLCSACDEVHLMDVLSLAKGSMQPARLKQTGAQVKDNYRHSPFCLLETYPTPISPLSFPLAPTGPPSLTGFCQTQARRGQQQPTQLQPTPRALLWPDPCLKGQDQSALLIDSCASAHTYLPCGC